MSIKKCNKELQKSIEFCDDITQKSTDKPILESWAERRQFYGVLTLISKVPNGCSVRFYCTKGDNPNILLRNIAKNIINPAHTM